ncbi:hypothetical protein N0V90_009504 [Kalmusia sp. IMI 367209]|nr:hypothetical protein N0V90_009504 [Kalmusia sp. IMI 367209]
MQSDLYAEIKGGLKSVKLRLDGGNWEQKAGISVLFWVHDIKRCLLAFEDQFLASSDRRLRVAKQRFCDRIHWELNVALSDCLSHVGERARVREDRERLLKRQEPKYVRLPNDEFHIPLQVTAYRLSHLLQEVETIKEQQNEKLNELLEHLDSKRLNIGPRFPSQNRRELLLEMCLICTLDPRNFPKIQNLLDDEDQFRWTMKRDINQLCNIENDLKAVIKNNMTKIIGKLRQYLDRTPSIDQMAKFHAFYSYPKTIFAQRKSSFPILDLDETHEFKHTTFSG